MFAPRQKRTLLSLLISTSLAFLFLAACGTAPMREIKSLPGAEKKRVSFTMETSVKLSGAMNWLEFSQLIPPDIDYRQKVVSISFDPMPDSVSYKKGNRVATYVFVNPPEEFTLKATMLMEVYRYDLETARLGKVKLSSEEDPGRFLSSEKKIESGNDSIREQAERLTGADDEGTIRNIYGFVTGWLDYDHTKKTAWKGASQALMNQSGVCSDYADLFVALARAKGIPARKVSGQVLRKGEFRAGHAWVEAHLAAHGWVTFDPTWGDSADAETTFEYLPNRYITTNLGSRYDYEYSWRRGRGMVESVRYTFSVDGITPENDTDTKARTLPLAQFLADPWVKNDLTRYTKRFLVMSIVLAVPEEERARLLGIVQTSFLDRPLTEEEKKRLSDHVEGMEQFLKKAEGPLPVHEIKRFMKFAKVRLQIEAGTYGREQPTEAGHEK